jgi:excisionase family DNA binding protein
MEVIERNPGLTAGGKTPRLLTVKEVASRLGLTPSGVYSMVEAGRLPALALGGGKRPRIRVDEEELNRWLCGEPT